MGDVGGSINAADFNEDGNLDFAKLVGGVNEGTLGIFLGHGDGQFDLQNYPVCDLSLSLTVGDFNRDGHADIAVACYPFDAKDAPIPQNQQVNIFFGNGDGTFQDPIGAGFSAVFVIAGEFDGQ